MLNLIEKRLYEEEYGFSRLTGALNSIDEAQKRTQKALDLKKRDSLHTRQAYKEIDERCTSLMHKVSVQVDSLEDQVLLDCSKILGELDSEFNEILSKLT